MSSISFNNINRTVKVSGRERAYCNVFLERIATSVLGLNGRFPMRPPRDVPRMRAWVSLFPEGSSSAYMRDEAGWQRYADRLAARFDEDLARAITGMMGGEIAFGDVRTDGFTLQLNTAWHFGDVMRLAARIHGQCEVHGFVEGPNREWLAGIIERGYGKIFRKETQGYEGWGQVIELLKEADDSPVVMSYSGTENFPNPMGDARFSGDAIDDFYELPSAERWDIALVALRKKEAAGHGLELKPEGWDDFHFGERADCFDVLDYVDGATKEGT